MFGIRRREFVSAARRRGGGMAARGAGAAARADAADRRAHEPAADDPEGQPASQRSCKSCNNWAGPTAAICGSTPAGAQNDVDRGNRYAAELVALAPDIILAQWHRECNGVATVHPHLADRVRAGLRSGRRGLRRYAWLGRAATSPAL